MDEAEQLSLVREVCGTRGRQLTKRFTDALAVGAGYKKSGGEVSSDICLGLLVKRKKKRLGGLVRPIPQRIEVVVQRGGKRVRVAIPTDVEELGKGKPQAFNLAKGICAFNRRNSAQWVNGAACAVVVDKAEPANRFILGCHHVLALSRATAACKPVKTTDVGGRSSHSKFGQLFYPLPMAADGRPCLDAAISLIDHDSEVHWTSSDGIRPLRVEPGVKQPANCFVFTPDGPLPARFVKEWANYTLPYPRCGMVVIAAVYQFVAPTLGGHSGSPVMTTDGTLFGMHFWGDPAQQMALSIPAFVLFQSGLFPLNFDLAKSELGTG